MLLSIILFPLAISASAQEIRPLGQPVASAAESFTHTFDVAELVDGRVARHGQPGALDRARRSDGRNGRAHRFGAGQVRASIVPMPLGDAWSVLPDGSVARLAGADYVVD